MAIEIMTDATERHIWYDHPLTKELRAELEERIEEILNTWKQGGYVVPHSPEVSNNLNMTGLSNYQILESVKVFMKDLSLDVREEEVDNAAPY